MGSEDKSTGTEKKRSYKYMWYDVIVMLNPGFQQEIEFEVSPGMFLLEGANPSKEITPDDYEKAVCITVNKGDHTAVTMLWSIDATLELLSKITRVFLVNYPERAEEITKAIMQGVEDTTGL